MPKFAPPRPDKLTDRGTLEGTMAVLEHFFDLKADGYRCQTRDLWQVLLTAAARRSYIEATCNDLPGAPDSNTVRGYLNEQLTADSIRTLQRRCNRALASQVPDWVFERPQEVAFDLHDEPYYGQEDPDDPDNWVCRGEAQDATTRFYRCATAYLMRQDVRVTLAVEFVHPDDDRLRILQRLLRRVRALKIPLRRLFWDKAFCSVAVLRFLRAQPALSAIIAAPRRGKSGGVKALCEGQSSYRTQHTFRSPQQGEVTVPVGVVRTFSQRRDGSRVAQWLVYVLLNVPDDTPLPQVRKSYRRRFGVESSYRLMEQGRGRTTSPNPAWRFLFMGLALLIVNVWIALHWTYLRLKGSGPRRVARWALTLDRMARFLTRAVEAIYGVVSVVDPPYVKPVIY